MNIKEMLCAAIRAAAEKGMADGAFPEAALAEILLEVPPKKEMGDFATNFAMQSAKVFRMSPRRIADALVERLPMEAIDRVEIAGPGFINFYLKPDVIYEGLRSAIEAGERYGDLLEFSILTVPSTWRSRMVVARYPWRANTIQITAAATTARAMTEIMIILRLDLSF